MAPEASMPRSGRLHRRTNRGDSTQTVRTCCDDPPVGAFREELGRLVVYEERHRRLLARLGLVVVASVIVDVLGTVAVYYSERHAHGTEVKTWGDALFFSTVQLLTVSSQLQNPFTTAGRIVDVALEIWAVIVVAGSAGALATFFQTAD
jgi:hypothetical protein